MNQSEKRTHEQFQSQKDSQMEFEGNFERRASPLSSQHIQKENESKQSTQNQQRELSDKNNLKSLQQDEALITNLYDLEQLNYRVFMIQDYERSLIIQQLLREKVEESPEYHIQSALTYVALNDFDQAERFYNKAITRSKHYKQYYFDCEIVDFVPKTFLESIKYIQNNITCYKDKENQLIADCLFAYHIFTFHRPEKAIQMLKLLMKRYPQSYLPYFYASTCYYTVRQMLLHLKRVFIEFRIHKSGNNQFSLQGCLIVQSQRYSIYGYYLKKEKYQSRQEITLVSNYNLLDALRIYSLFPNNPYFKSSLQQVQKTIARVKREEEQQRLEKQNKMIIKQPGKLELEFQEKGIQHYNDRQYEKTIEYLHSAIQQNSDNGLCQYTLGNNKYYSAKCYLKLGDLDKAWKHSQVALRQKQKNSIKLQTKIVNERNRLELEGYDCIRFF